MQFPLEIGIGNFKISGHLFFETAAMMIGFRYFLFLRRRQQDKISDSNRVWIIIAAALGALLFSRIIGSLEDPQAFFSSSNPMLFFYANKTIIGGLLGALLFVEIVKYFLREKSSSGDMFTFPLILAIMIGRIGCFTSGVHEETYGRVTESFLGMDLGDGKLRYPICLFEIFFLLILWIGLAQLEKMGELKNGNRFKLFMIGYLCFRFFMDFEKPLSFHSIGLGTIQICCLLGLIYYLKTLKIILLQPSKLFT